MTKTYSIVLSHFGAPFWITHTLRQISRLGSSKIVSVTVINQNRDRAANLSQFPGATAVLQFPQNEELIAAVGHDHPHSLNRAIRESKFESTHVIVMDSDCFPAKESWLSLLEDDYEAHLAQDPSKWGLTHPCFMVFPVEATALLDFERGLLSIGIDSGRLVGLQLAEGGLPPKILPPERTAWGKGDYYLDKTIYHHGSGSFSSSSDARLLRQSDSAIEKVYLRAISAGRLHLTFAEKALLWLLRLR